MKSKKLIEHQFRNCCRFGVKGQKIMKFPIAIEQGDSHHIWGVVVPDLPGCFSGSNRGIEHAIDNSKEAIELWIETALDMGQVIPQPSLISKFHLQNEYSGWIWAAVEIDTTLLSDEMKRFTPLL